MVELSKMIDSFVVTVRAELQAELGENLELPAPFTPTDPVTDLASFIDHTLLKADATPAEIEKICLEAREFGFASVCVNSSYVAFAAKRLEGSKTIPIAVVGFPLGAASTQSKAFEARQAVEDGACEIDMVIHLGALKSRDYEKVHADIRSVVEAAKPWPVKVILETCLLNDEQKIAGCAIAKAAGAAFVKTSTGFSTGGATVADVKLMRRSVGLELGVKASGGIRTREDALKMIEAGATRIGASAGVSMVSSNVIGNPSGSSSKGSY